MRATVATLSVVLASAVWGAAGCGDDGDVSETRPRERGSATLGAGVVSTVDGRPITLEDVRGAVERTGLTPREALRRLEEQELLAAEAERSGYADSPVVRRSAARAAARATLEHLVESAVEAGSITEAELREAYDQQRDRFHAPERRASIHVLAPVASDAPEAQWRTAEAEAAEALEQLRSRTDPLAQLIQWRDAGFEGHEGLRIEDVQPVGEGDSVESAYLEALFELDAPGLVPEVVRTYYGCHVVYMTEVVPARSVSFEDASAELREELLVRRRHERLVEVLEQLRHEHGVERREEVVLRALAEDPLSASVDP